MGALFHVGCYWGVTGLSKLDPRGCPPPPPVLKLRSFCLYRFSKKAWNPHSAMEYGICWITGTREFQ